MTHLGDGTFAVRIIGSKFLRGAPGPGYTFQFQFCSESGDILFELFPYLNDSIGWRVGGSSTPLLEPGGSFIAGAPDSRLRRILVDGSLDPDFAGPEAQARLEVKRLPDGRLLVDGIHRYLSKWSIRA